MKRSFHEKQNCGEILENNDTDSFSAFKNSQITQFAFIKKPAQ